MTAADVLMLALGVVAVGAAAAVVTSRQIVRAGLWLVVALGAIAGLYLALAADLVAWVQVLIYVGAVVVLLLFAVMLTRAPIGVSDDLDRGRWPGALVGAGAGLGLAALLIDAYRWSTVDLPEGLPAEAVGSALFRSWVLPFEVLSVLLLAALVGAIVISRPDVSRGDRSSGERAGQAARASANRAAGAPAAGAPASPAAGASGDSA